MRDISNEVQIAQPKRPSLITHFSLHRSLIVDVRGFRSLIWVGGINVISGTYSVSVEHTDDYFQTETWEDVPSENMLGRAEALDGIDGTIIAATSGPVMTIRVGITSKKRYHRYYMPNSSGYQFSSLAMILGRPDHGPTAPIYYPPAF